MCRKLREAIIPKPGILPLDALEPVSLPPPPTLTSLILLCVSPKLFDKDFR